MKDPLFLVRPVTLSLVLDGVIFAADSLESTIDHSVRLNAFTHK